ncbi:MAG: DUF58 domain-containing protein [Acidobacteria bacterium]|nr:DUF58 domain-containing protein [Acidobacteriota bacterium]
MSCSAIKLTKRGRNHLLFIIAILIAAVNTGNNLLYLILSFMLSLLFFSFFAPRFLFKGVDIAIELPPYLYAGERARLKVRIENRKRYLPSPPFYLKALGSLPLSTPPFLPSVLGGESFEDLLFEEVRRRGLYRMEGLLAATPYPFGLFLSAKTVPTEEREFLVYPRIFPISSFIVHGIPGEKAMVSLFKGRSMSLRNIRDYTYGDEVRFLHWKASAKLSKLMVKEFSRKEELKVTILLPTFVSPNFSREEFELRVSFAASLAFYLIGRDYFVRLITSHSQVPFGVGGVQLHKILRELALVEPVTRASEDLVERELKAGEASLSSFRVLIADREYPLPRGALVVPLTAIERIGGKEKEREDPE